MNNEKIVAIIAAAGKGERMGCGTNKLFLEVVGRPVVALTIDAFEGCPLVDEIILVVNDKDAFSFYDLIDTEGYTKVEKIVSGGKTRQESVLLGIREAGKCSKVVIHDGARPLVTPEQIENVINAAHDTGAACLAVPAVDTIKTGDKGFFTGTLDRNKLWLVQTPQVFDRGIILEAYDKGDGAETDDASLVEKLGTRVAIVQGSYENIKITTQVDIMIAEAIINQRMEW